MEYNFITNIESCIQSATQIMHGNLSLVYYSHIPVAIIALIIGFFVIVKNKKDLSAKVMFFLSLVFSIWVMSNFISWISSSSIAVTYTWSLFGLINSLLFLSCLYLVYVYKNNNDMPIWLKVILGVLLLPVIYMTPTYHNVGDFNYSYCYPADNLFLGYMDYFKSIITIIIICVSVRRFFIVEKEKRREIVLISLGSILFLLSIFGTGYISESLQRYDIEVYGIFAMPLFLGFLAYLIVKYRAFDIKLLAAQALVVALLILIGSQFLFIQIPINRLLTAITLIVAMIIGLSIIRSVRKEVALREELEIANNNQMSLIHFISHQLKGFFTKSKMIFAGILQDDFGQTSDDLKRYAQEGLDSDNNAVAMIQDILGASNLKKGTTAYDFKEVDFAEVVKEMCKNFEDEMQAKNLALDIQVEDKPFIISADKKQITQVVKNLIDNSIKYTPSGSIKISLKNYAENQNKIILKIQDTGVGLSESDKKKLFTEGGKGDESLKVNVNSTGYGLYIVKKIVENHHGRIWAESAGRGHGSQFYVELPRK